VIARLARTGRRQGTGELGPQAPVSVGGHTVGEGVPAVCRSRCGDTVTQERETWAMPVPALPTGQLVTRCFKGWRKGQGEGKQRI